MTKKVKKLLMVISLKIALSCGQSVLLKAKYFFFSFLFSLFFFSFLFFFFLLIFFFLFSSYLLGKWLNGFKERGVPILCEKQKKKEKKRKENILPFKENFTFSFFSFSLLLSHFELRYPFLFLTLVRVSFLVIGKELVD